MALRTKGPRRNSSSSSECSATSHLSGSTALTVYSTRLSLENNWTNSPINYADYGWNDAYCASSEARLSTGTYASTLPSEEDIADEITDEHLVYDEPDNAAAMFSPLSLPSSPHEFAMFFPSTRRLCIRHDDTVDGNMNLRINTEKHIVNGSRVDLTLFHLRMHDLKSRDFSLRRYCRDSGREVCHSSRRYTNPPPRRRPGLQKSMSNALANFRSKSENRVATATSLQRQDSGYDTMSDNGSGVQGKSSPPTNRKPSSIPLPTNTINLEFSNYAHVDLKRRGTRTTKRYEFEYWGTAYSWRRVVGRNGKSKEVSYHLYNTDTLGSVAHIVPIPMTPLESHEEELKGGWIPPSSMWISDERILGGLTDVAE